MDAEQWKKLTNALSIAENRDTFKRLQAAYAEKHRYYHTGAHIDFCLALFAEFRSDAREPADVECAIWFHDAIYNPMSKDNEAKSAAWAVKFLTDNGRSRQQCDRVQAFVMATRHDAAAQDADTQLLVDIDLGVLGSNAATYNAFERNVRREYKWVPWPIFRRERRKILQSFLDRDSVYFTAAMRDRFEDQARTNIAAALTAL